jgi:hypothetical protein
MRTPRTGRAAGDRKVVLAVSGFAVLGLAAIASVGVVMTRHPRPSPHERAGLKGLVTQMADSLYAAEELRAAADVVVERAPSGALHVSGRALPKPVTVPSTAALEALLGTLPRPGSAVVMVQVTHDAGGIQGLVAPAPPEAAASRQELLAILQEAGFHEARGSVKTLLPLEVEGDSPSSPSAR